MTYDAHFGVPINTSASVVHIPTEVYDQGILNNFIVVYKNVFLHLRYIVVFNDSYCLSQTRLDVVCKQTDHSIFFQEICKQLDDNAISIVRRDKQTDQLQCSLDSSEDKLTPLTRKQD